MELAALVANYADLSSSDEDPDDPSHRQIDLHQSLDPKKADERNGSHPLPLFFASDDHQEGNEPSTSSGLIADSHFSESYVVEHKQSKRPKIDASPAFSVDVIGDPTVGKQSQIVLRSQSQSTIGYNPKVTSLLAPVLGPVQPHQNDPNATPKNFWTGYVEKFAISDSTFDQQFNAFNRFGFSVDPLAQVSDARRKRKREEKGDPTKGSYDGPWASFEPTEEEIQRDELMRQHIKEQETTEQTLASAETLPAVKFKPAKEVPLEKTVFHGLHELDFQGRSYIDPPSDLRISDDHPSFIPKKRVHTWVGHSKAVNAIRLFPKTGHLLLSAGLDGKVKLWDVYNERRVLRTFLGHSRGVRDVCFSNDGRKFLSASFEKTIKLWDTETGQCINRLSNSGTPVCVRFFPDDENQFLTGSHDRKIYQWDMKANEAVQVYNRHLGAVNSVTLIDNNRRFVSTSDDKSIRVWEYGIPVEIKVISEPHMHSMPAVTLTPNKKYFGCQSLDNNVLLYKATEPIKINKRKHFKGHTVAGYACQIDFSPDGKYVISGDSIGNLFVWDWKSCRVYRKLKAHEGVAISCLWHPQQGSGVVTCGWDGRIHLWD